MLMSGKVICDSEGCYRGNLEAEERKQNAIQNRHEAGQGN